MNHQTLVRYSECSGAMQSFEQFDMLLIISSTFVVFSDYFGVLPNMVIIFHGRIKH